MDRQRTPARASHASYGLVVIHRTVLVAVLVAACGTPAPAPPSATATATGPTSRVTTTARVTATDPLGSLALVTSIDEPTAPFIPRSRTRQVVDPSRKIAPQASVRIVSATRGDGVFTAGSPEKLPFGCDGNQLDVTPLVGPDLAPGLAWILPANVTWRPLPLTVAAGKASPTARSYRAGPLHFDLQRVAAARGTTTITLGSTVVAERPFERQLMDGADASLATIDLVDGGPGVPVPVAAWAIDRDGPYLVVVSTPSWEGLGLEALLVDATSATPIEAMSIYLYQCAF